MGDTAVINASTVDADWLTEALSTRCGGARVTGFTAASIGTGQVGENVRFRLEWDRDDPDLPASVVAKFPSASELSREAAKLTGTYVREVGFYRDLCDAVTMTVPEVHRVEWDPDTHEFVLLMTDLCESEQGDQLAGCTVDVAHAVIDEAVGLHAPTWGRTEQWRGLDWLGFPNPERTMQMTGLLHMLLPGYLERFTGRMSDDDLDVGRLLVERYGRWTELVTAWAEGPGDWCVTHGDYRLDNLLLGRSSGAPAVTVVDWQTVAVGIGPADVAYFVGAGLLADDRRRHERALVERYAAGLREHGVDVDDETVWEGYVLGTASGYLMAVIASQLVEQTERGDLMFMAMAERPAEQMRELGLFDRL
ncbi:MAG: phosphotransferase [Ilumatobacter sp.]|nr:phosphotransferase [Ilumatobacter sp.]